MPKVMEGGELSLSWFQFRCQSYAKLFNSSWALYCGPTLLLFSLISWYTTILGGRTGKSRRHNIPWGKRCSAWWSFICFTRYECVGGMLSHSRILGWVIEGGRSRYGLGHMWYSEDLSGDRWKNWAWQVRGRQSCFFIYFPIFFVCCLALVLGIISWASEQVEWKHFSLRRIVLWDLSSSCCSNLGVSFHHQSLAYLTFNIWIRFPTIVNSQIMGLIRILKITVSF